MRKTAFLIFTFLFTFAGLQAQHKVEVPSRIHFADIRLDLTPEARKKIQTDVDALLRHEKYFTAKVNKVDSYLPLIEQVLREENVPDDIKYLVIQESALVGDAVSSSNAVGYWQFKAPTGREVGLTINNEVDERMNIITATRGAARYFKNNNTYFDNWLYALLAYYAGPGGALKIADKKYYSKREMRLDGNTHWYVIKFLAHKIAFEQAVGKNPRPEMLLFTYTEGNGKTLAQVAREFDLQETDLEPYNKWVRRNRIPDDKRYYVIIPDYSGRRTEPILAQRPDRPQPDPEPAEVNFATSDKDTYVSVEDTRRFPLIQQTTRWGKKVTLINGIPGVVAAANDNVRAISQQTGVSPSRLVKLNDLTSRQAEVSAGVAVYLKRKRSKAQTHYHVVEPGENLWTISQRFGIRLNKLLRNNRMRKEEPVKPGQVLWLRFIRPPHIPVEYRPVPDARPASNTVASRKPVQSTPPKGYPESAAKQETVIPEPAERAEPESRQQPAPSPDTRPARQEQPEATIVTEVKPTETATEKPVAFPETQQQEADKPLVPVISSTVKAGKKEAVDSHTVQAGETLYSIARQYDLTIPQLTSYNDISWEIPLAVGQKLRLSPAAAEGQDMQSGKSEAYGEKTLVHEVQSGETMYKVARQYEVTIKELMEWNNKEDFNVSVGEKLTIRKHP